MDIQIQKLELIEWLVSINDRKIIDSLTKFKNSENIVTKETLTVSQKKAIDDAFFQVENKETISHELVIEETKKRYPNYFQK